MTLLQLYKSHKGVLLKSSYVILLYFTIQASKPSSKPPNKSSTSQDDTGDVSKASKPPKLHTHSIRKIIRSIVPSFNSPVVYYFISQIILLTVRALLTLKVASLDGLLVSSLIKKRTKLFLKLLTKWMLLGIPASFTNSLLNFTTSQLSLSINKNITNGLMSLYLPENKNPNYYSLIHNNNSGETDVVQGEKKVKNEVEIKDPNQRITVDVSNFSNSVAQLPNHVLKPLLDLLLCSFELSKSGSGEGTLILGIIAYLSSILLKILSPNFTKISVQRSNLEGIFRSLHSRVFNFNEQISILRGEKRELDILDKSYYELESFTNYEIRARAIYDVAINFIVKYTWGACGLILCSTPIFLNKFNGIMNDSNISASFVTNRRLLLSASSSLGMLITSRKEIQQVIGYLNRLSEFKSNLLKIEEKQKQKQTDVDEEGENKRDFITYNDDMIEFKNVPLITPANVKLVDKLSFKIKHGDHLLIAGPNGCGKSSLFRILGGLWTIKSDDPETELIIPHNNSKNLFYLPQRAYLSKSTLKELIIYPDDEYKYGKDYKPLLKILKLLDLQFIIKENISIELKKHPLTPVESIDAFGIERNWSEELSIGVQQRLAMTRLYYHRPKFAVLDECTSAVSPQMEQKMYENAQKLGISLLSVAHRSSLWHFHNYLLKFRGDGSYFFKKFDYKERLNWENELIEINKQLRDVPILEAKLKELKIAQESQEIRRSRSQLAIAAN